jgi:hypothetical protein
VLALALASKAEPPKTVAPTQDVLELIVAAVASRNPAVMRREADQIESRGYAIQATELRRAADLTAAILAATDPGGGGQVMQGDDELAGDDIPDRAPSVPQPFSPLPGVLDEEVIAPDVDPLRIQAQALLLNLERNPLGKEDRRLVADFQRNNSLRASGNYTPETALTLAEDYGLPPPPPYWPTKGRRKSKENYKRKLLALAARDPQRAEEFERAAKNA